jgi:hypothetical protein
MRFRNSDQGPASSADCFELPKAAQLTQGEALARSEVEHRITDPCCWQKSPTERPVRPGQVVGDPPLGES